MFDRTFQEIKKPFLSLMAAINKEHNSFAWWGGQVASRNSASTPLIRTITYLFCAEKILANGDKDIIFISDSRALSECISKTAVDKEYQVKKYSFHFEIILKNLRDWPRYMLQAGYFFWRSWNGRRLAVKLLKPVVNKKQGVIKKVVIRTWVTKGSFDKNGNFKNRNFGVLPKWLADKGYEVYILPMFFNLPLSIREIYSLIRNQSQKFLIPDSYLKLSDYFETFINSLKVLLTRIGNARINSVDITPIFNESIKEAGLAPELSILNLSSLMLKRLKERGFETGAFYYPFENNPPEKQFILACRKYFPQAKIIGFQHTVSFPNQLAYHLLEGEYAYTPLPDKLVCSGQKYLQLYKKAGFPENILFLGANLRFEDIYTGSGKNEPNSKVKNILVILPGLPDYYAAFELLHKVNEALKGQECYKVYIRNHPVLSKDTIIKFCSRIHMAGFKFCDEGAIQDWLPEMYAVLSIGTSITALEAAVMSVPVLHIIPDNTVFFDPLNFPDYPVSPATTPLEIKKQLELIGELKYNNNIIFNQIARQIMEQYFIKPADENLKEFL
jgi:hypothetical protein